MSTHVGMYAKIELGSRLTGRELRRQTNDLTNQLNVH